jgi:hypothetical protein
MSDVRKTEPGNAVYLNIGAWYEEKTGQIHLTLPRSAWFHTTVNANDGSVRCHKNLYTKLARALNEAGVPAPTVSDTEDV